MMIYFAGVPAGNQQWREERLEEDGIKSRLITFFYLKRALITLCHYGGAEYAKYEGEKDYDQRINS